MKIELLGVLVVETPNGERVTFQTEKARALLAYLAANANRPIKRSTLAALLWGSYPDKVARRNLTNTLSRLRKDVEPYIDGGTNDWLVATRQDIQLVTTANIAVDTERVDGLWAQCHGVPQANWGDEPAVIDALKELVALIRGRFLQGLTLPDCLEFETWAAWQAEQYQQNTLTALAFLAQHHLEQSDFDAAIAYAQQQLAREVWRETAHRQLIEAYLGAGQRAAATAQVEKCRRVLWEELGVEPAAETVALLQRPTAAAPVQTRTRRKRRLSTKERNPFFGRARELAQLQHLLLNGGTRLITLHGAGGIGKTRLAQAVGRVVSAEFADGTTFVPLVNVKESAGVIATIIAALGLRLQGRADPLTQLCDYLADKEMLLILDNFEHLLVAADTVIDPLLEILEIAPDVVLLLTSRQRLWVQAEQLVTLKGLPFPQGATDEPLQEKEAVQLFVSRIRQVRPNFDPETARAAIIEICQLVEGLPLGIELAAAQSATRSCAAVAAELNTGIALSTRLRDIPQRQRSLQAVFAYSWQLLEAEIRPVLAKCAIMQGDFSYEAFQAVTGGGYAEIETLLAHALIRRAGYGRFDMHEMMRRFALTHLSDEHQHIAHNLYKDYFLQFITDHYQGMFSTLEPSLAAIQQEWLHLERAWFWVTSHPEEEGIQQLYAALPTLLIYLHHMGPSAEIMTMIRTAQSQIAKSLPIDAPPPPIMSRLLGMEAYINHLVGNAGVAIPLAEQLLAQHQDAWATALAYYIVGIVQYVTGQVNRLEQTITRAYTLAEQHQLWFFQIVMAYLSVNVFANYQQPKEAERWGQRSKQLAEKIPSAHYTLFQESWLLFWRWKISDGLVLHAQTRKIRNQFHLTPYVDASDTYCAFAMYRVGAFSEAIKLLSIVGNLKKSQHLNTSGLYVLSLAMRRLGEIEQAIGFGQEAVKRTDGHGAGIFQLQGRNALGLALCAASRPTEAKVILCDALERMQNSEATDNWYMLIEGSLAHSHAVADEWDMALAVVDRIYERLLAADSIYAHIEQTWFCYQILRHHDDPRAAALHQHAREVIAFRTSQISDPAHRQLFLNNFPEHLAIMAEVDTAILNSKSA